MKDSHYSDTYEVYPAVVTLPGIEIDVPVPEGVFYKDLGKVSSISAAFAEEKLRLGGIIGETRGALDRVLNRFYIGRAKNNLERKNPNIGGIYGNCVREWVGRGGIKAAPEAYMLAAIDYDRSLNGNEYHEARCQTIFGQGYASCKFLDAIHQWSVLQPEMDRRDINLDCVSYVNNKEAFAKIGGLLALRKCAERKLSGIHVPEFKGREWLDEDRYTKLFGF